jgi:pyruvate-formate lyase-activating enzyme
MGKTTPRVELDRFSLLSVKEPFVRVVILTQICSLKCKYVTNLRILKYHLSLTVQMTNLQEPKIALVPKV